MKYLAVFLTLLSGCQLSNPPAAEDYLPGLAVAIAASANGNAPEPQPVVDECFTCGGQGWLGGLDEKVDCPDCEVDWKGGSFEIPPLEFIPDETAETAKPATAATAATAAKPAIVQEEKHEPVAVTSVKKPWLKAYTRPDCVPCQQFKHDAYDSSNFPRLAALIERYDLTFVYDQHGQVPRYAVEGSQFLGYNPSNAKQHNDFLDWLSFNSRSVKPCDAH